MFYNTELTEEEYNQITQVAIDWQYLIVLSGGMARKSDCEAYLTKRFGIDAYTGRQISNGITEGPRYFTCGSSGVDWQEWVAHRPAPMAEDYPDIDYSVGEIIRRR